MIEIKNSFTLKNHRLYRVVKSDNNVSNVTLLSLLATLYRLFLKQQDGKYYKWTIIGYYKTYERIKKVYCFKNMRKFIT